MATKVVYFLLLLVASRVFCLVSARKVPADHDASLGEQKTFGIPLGGGGGGPKGIGFGIPLDGGGGGGPKGIGLVIGHGAHGLGVGIGLGGGNGGGFGGGPGLGGIGGIGGGGLDGLGGGNFP